MEARTHARRSQLARLFVLLSALVALAFGGSGCANYDELVEKDQKAAQKWADVEATLQRRYDLVPNLVETAKASAKFEKETLEAVTKARADATAIKMDASALTDPEKMKQFVEAQGQLKGALSRLLVAAEKYPDLKASEAFKGLQVQLEGTENRILRAREEYNKAVAEYNTALGKVKGQVVNKATGMPFKPREYFKMEAAAQAAPKVSF